MAVVLLPAPAVVVVAAGDETIDVLRPVALLWTLLPTRMSSAAADV